MAALMANNLSVVISSDDRTTFDAAPLSHDFYVVFLTMSSEMADLTLLKQLAINSIKYSSLDPARKEAAMKLWQTKWDTFVGEPPTSAAPVRASTTKQNNGASGLLAPWTSFFLGTKLVVYLGISRLSTL
ncbi:adenosine deaminase 2-like [Physella acuta]|uniref:adenosine deaminase 2-like n=1 Tax=Physella acuta TaxID=109671 RepID=UPI0027DD7D6F|nr:adenosine deaminase 2-like [Physella acuta]